MGDGHVKVKSKYRKKKTLLRVEPISLESDRLSIRNFLTFIYLVDHARVRERIRILFSRNPHIKLREVHFSF